jgi:hypothetical protein
LRPPANQEGTPPAEPPLEEHDPAVEEEAGFETVLSLRIRAERGEPFCRIDGRWYQCKSSLSRQFFF